MDSSTRLTLANVEENLRRRRTTASNDSKPPPLLPQERRSWSSAVPAGGALASMVFACFLLLSRSPSSATAFVHSIPFRTHALLSLARPAGAAAAGARCGLGAGEVQQHCHRRRMRQRGASKSSSICMRRHDDMDDAPLVDPFDERKMAGSGQQVINWCAAF